MQFRYLAIYFNQLWKIAVLFGSMVLMSVIITKIANSLICSITSNFFQDEIITEEEASTEVYYDFRTYEVKTYRGLVTMEELNEKVFKRFGFEISHPTLPVPTLRTMPFEGSTCTTVFSYTHTLPNGNTSNSSKLKNEDFLMNGFAALNQTIPKSKTGEEENRPKNWDKISEMMELTKEEIIKVAHNGEAASMLSALRMFSVDGMSGLVVGSVTPWLEVMALQNGAQQILTVERNDLEIEEEYRDRLLSMSPSEFADKWGMYAESFDFVATFGFVEKSGLGLHNEPMDPIGDLREIMKIKCVLKEGGLLYLGLPYGTDALQLRTQRIYGSVRIALMFSGFEWIATFNGKSQRRVQLNSQKRRVHNLFNPIYYTFVLKKL